jgi:hypothetical protein
VSRNHMLYGKPTLLLYLFSQLICLTFYLTLNDRTFRFLPFRILCHIILTFIYFSFLSVFNFMLPYFLFYTYSPSCTFYTVLTSLYTQLLLRHSIGFIPHDMLHILILYLLYILDIPPIRFVFQVTQEDLISSLTMAGYC